jgi:hypothetical protein
MFKKNLERITLLHCWKPLEYSNKSLTKIQIDFFNILTLGVDYAIFLRYSRIFDNNSEGLTRIGGT